MATRNDVAKQADVKPVTLPHDMMITLPRRADAQSGSQWGRKIAEKIKTPDGSRFTINSINGMVSVMDWIFK
jgi:hypothetical protein